MQIAVKLVNASAKTVQELVRQVLLVADAQKQKNPNGLDLNLPAGILTDLVEGDTICQEALDALDQAIEALETVETLAPFTPATKRGMRERLMEIATRLRRIRRL